MANGPSLTLTHLLFVAVLLLGCDSDLREPAIEHIVPAQGAPGQVIEVLGRGFGTEAGFVSFSGIVAEDNGWEHDRIQIVVPSGLPGESEVAVVVTAAGAPSIPSPFLIK